MRKRSFHLIGQLFSHVPPLARWCGRRFAALRSDEVPFAPLRKPLHACRVALVTTGGVHLRNQTPFNMADSHGDPTFRDIPTTTPRSQLTITHDYYDHSDAERDLNILYPLDLFHELAEQRIIGSLATGYSFMGHIEPPHVETLIHKTAPTVASKLKQDRVDCVLLTPA